VIEILGYYKANIIICFISSRGANHLRAFPVAPINLSKEEAEKLFYLIEVV